MPKLTISDIAQRAGVSKTAVSFAFNYPERLSEETLRHILAVAEEAGYSPDPVASNLKTRRTGCIGILVPQPIPIMTRNPHTLAFIEGVGDVCHEMGLSLMLVPPLKGNLRRAIVRAAVDGFLTLGLETFRGTMMVLQQRGVPFVMVDSDPTPDIPCVNIDDEAGAYAAMSYALRMGHRRITILGIRSGYHGDYRKYAGTLQRRIAGYTRALGEVGLSLDDPGIHLLECECDLDGGVEGLETVLQSRTRPTAIVAMADVIAIGVMRAAREHHIDLPGKLSIIGYDDIEASGLTCPALTTIRQPTVAKGRVAAELLIQRIENPDITPEHITLPVDLIERDSFRAK
ncbi:MAG TPA: LacI family DNA-binding transcriptional regulator [Aggregatilinea sp.]|jgi:DNA-binding LacI/PurR family transcriptional regulator|uniref:LacI family DNA-binding transcriptional regulator n=1 Tax=Aggregatilinea sp. TaxID=2806333 RepID=UPI002C10E8B3|nr:LacI family DNA-binding transcriptional regulator [Aggregatilinea sp.]HML20264.1 LacI family DNA-binding transcriptional regulator [Aggregatilinea sp.]